MYYSFFSVKDRQSCIVIVDIDISKMTQTVKNNVDEIFLMSPARNVLQTGRLHGVCISLAYSPMPV